MQTYNAAPAISAFVSNALVATGGLSPITVPVQGVSMTQGQWVGYDGSFNQPGDIPGIQNAEFNLCAFVTAIPFGGLEGLVQVDYSVVPLIEARMNDATEQTYKTFSNALFNNTSVTGQQITGLPGAIDDGTFSSFYGGLSRTTNTWWRSTYVHNTVATVPTRNLMAQYIAQLTKAQGEMPKMGLCNFGTWTMLAEDFTSQERYNITPDKSFGTGKISSLFRALDVMGVPVYADPYCPEGTIYFLNPDYINLYIHEKAGFYFTGFESMLTNMQFGYIGAILTLLQLVNVKPSTQMKVDGISFLGI